MKINHNISAVITNKQLLRTEDSLAASMERLSSGLSINHAKDNPSGMAISGKMKAQIDGLDMASRNSSDGISVIETADGALSEVSDIIQRIRELSVQAANDTNAQSEREHIQTEIDSLKSEIDRISSTTEFNSKRLLDGSLDARVYPSKDAGYILPERIQVNENVAEGTYEFNVTKAATQAEGELDFSSAFPVGGTLSSDMSFSINSVPVYLKKGMSDDEVYGKILEAAEIADVEIEDNAAFKADHKLSINSKGYGSDARLHVVTGQSGIDFKVNGAAADDDTTYLGEDAEVTLTVKDPSNPAVKSQFDGQTFYKMEGNKMTVQSTQGFKMTMKLPEGQTGKVSLNVTDIGPMALQIGANEGQQMNVRVPSTDLDHLYLDEVDVTIKGGADKAMALCDDAITRLSEIRASLGAYENRLEHTVASLDTTEENMTAALSRIGDVDMATEMVEYTKDNVLSQAGTSALSQANELPQMALQLLG